MNDEEFFEEVVARLDDLEGVPTETLFDLVTREGVCMSPVHVGTEQPTWTADTATDREVAATICAGCPVTDKCLELEFRTAGFTTLGVWGALAEDDRRAAYLAWLLRRDNSAALPLAAPADVVGGGGGVLPGHCAPLEIEPVSVHAPYVARPDGQYRHEDAAQRRAALLEALRGVALGAYDQRILHWLTGWDISVVAVVVSLLWRARRAAAQENRDGGESL